eukprot:3199256-Alexandrium_andersonii.AAC.1
MVPGRGASKHSVLRVLCATDGHLQLAVDRVGGARRRSPYRTRLRRLARNARSVCFRSLSSSLEPLRVPWDGRRY